uniref:Uncharacterized protein n=1 Tax=Arundo donax TaxID=35708 RepID=A0A0A9AFT9_ARUDO
MNGAPPLLPLPLQREHKAETPEAKGSGG